jgi:hypothetical protein
VDREGQVEGGGASKRVGRLKVSCLAAICSAFMQKDLDERAGGSRRCRFVWRSGIA